MFHGINSVQWCFRCNHQIAAKATSPQCAARVSCASERRVLPNGCKGARICLQHCCVHIRNDQSVALQAAIYTCYLCKRLSVKSHPRRKSAITVLYRFSSSFTMGTAFSHFFPILPRLLHRPIRVIVLGVDGSGQTTLLNYIARSNPSTSSPGEQPTIEMVCFTIGLNFEVLRLDNMTITGHALGGGRPLAFRRLEQETIIQNAESVIWIIAEWDRDRFAETIEELRQFVFSQEEMKGVPVLVLINQRDRKGCIPFPDLMSSEEIKHALCASEGAQRIGIPTGPLHGDNRPHASLSCRLNRKSHGTRAPSCGYPRRLHRARY